MFNIYYNSALFPVGAFNDPKLTEKLRTQKATEDRIQGSEGKVKGLNSALQSRGN